jgi:hypothetical protein
MDIILYFIKEDKFAIVDKNDVIDILYEGLAEIRKMKIENDILYEYKYEDKDNTFLFLKSKIKIKYSLDEMKDRISKINNKVPLYDIYSHNLYLIFRDNVYDRVIYKSYRFPDKELYAKLEDNKMKIFLNNFNLTILQQTYISVFYYYSNKVGKNLTLCIRPSFLPHLKYINPYYGRNELINIGLNMGIIKEDDTYYDKDEKLLELCKNVQENDINKKIILTHQKYIVDNCGMHKVIYYTMHGSYFMNKYLRNPINNNKLIENNILSLWKLIKNSPPFDKSYSLYRFIQNDQYINHLKINEIYTEKSFISATRDPFYSCEQYKFGFILIKIKIPKDVVGTALCIETFSNFKKEQEIIFPPLTRLQLIAKDKNCGYYHIDQKFKKNVVTKYEFKFIDNLDIQMPTLKNKIKDTYINFDNLINKTYNYSNFDILVNNFVNDHVNKNYQFQTTINNKLYTFTVEWYNSDSVYQDFYSIKNKNGVSIYIQNPNTMNISLMIEIHPAGMHINYYSKFSYNDEYIDLNTIDAIKFISSIAYIFGIKNTYIHQYYKSCSDFVKENNDKNTQRILEMYNYRQDFYEYLVNKNKRFDEQLEIKAQFFYYELDSLSNTNPNKILIKEDKDELHRICRKSKIDNLHDFYIYIIKNHSDKIQLLEDKMDRMFEINNPFIRDFYLLQPLQFLYNKKFISNIPTINIKNNDTIKEYNKSHYRINIDDSNLRRNYKR